MTPQMAFDELYEQSTACYCRLCGGEFRIVYADGQCNINVGAPQTEQGYCELLRDLSTAGGQYHYYVPAVLACWVRDVFFEIGKKEFLNADFDTED